MLPFLKEATNALSSACGLSQSFLRAASTIESQGKRRFGDKNEPWTFNIAAEFVPKTLQEAKEMKSSGVALFNVARRGPTQSESVLRIRMLACEAIRLGGNNVEEDDTSTLDCARAFATTGVLLCRGGGVEGKQLGLRALRCALQLGGGEAFVGRLESAFGDSQEAHDCAAAQFGALVALTSETLRGIVITSNEQQRDDETKKQEEEIATDFQLVYDYVDLALRAGRTSQKALRDVLEAGGCALAEKKEHGGNSERLAALVLTLLVRDLEEMWGDPGQRARARVALAIAKARVGETAEATAILDQRGVCESREVQPPATWLGERVARVVVMLARLGDEERGGGSAARIEASRCEVLAVFASLVRAHCMNPTQSGLVAVLSTASSVCEKTQSFQASYGELLLNYTSLEKNNSSTCGNVAPWTFRTLSHAYRHGGIVGQTGTLDMLATQVQIQAQGSKLLHLHSDDNVSTPKVQDDHLEREAMQDLCRAVWTNASNAFADGRWKDVLNASALVTSLTTDPTTLCRAKVAAAVSLLRDCLPDPSGDSSKELETLESIERLCNESLQNVGEAPRQVVARATLTRLEALSRASILSDENEQKEDDDDVPLAFEKLAVACEAAKNVPLTTNEMMAAVADAMGCGAIRAATMLLESAREVVLLHVQNNSQEQREDETKKKEAKDIRNELAMITARLVNARMQSKQFHELALDAALLGDLLSCCQETTNKNGADDDDAKTNAPFFRDVDMVRCTAFNAGIALDDQEQQQEQEEKNELAFQLLCASAMLSTALGKLNDADRAHIAASGTVLRAAVRAVGSLKRMIPARVAQLASQGLQSAEAVVNRDVRVGGLAVLSTLLMCAPGPTQQLQQDDGTQDEDIKKRLDELLDSEFPQVQASSLMANARLARDFGFQETCVALTVRAIQVELGLETPDYEVVADALAFMISFASAGNGPELSNLVDQVDAVRSVARDAFPPHALESVAVALWRKKRGGVLSLRATEWMALACSQSEEIALRRRDELCGMRAVCSSSSSVTVGS